MAPLTARRQDFNEVNRDILVARDEQIARIVAMVDGLPERGDADLLIAPLRARLARLRVKRPLNFARLLFTPLDPLIVPGEAWRRDRVALPRTALVPLAAQCRALLGPAAEQIERALAGVIAGDHAAIGEAGAALWPLAAAALPRAPPTRMWRDATGLTDADHADATRLVAVVLREAGEIEMMAARDRDGRQVNMAELRLMLARAARAGGGRALGGLVAVLLARLPDTQRVLAAVGEVAAGQVDPAVVVAADQAMDLMLDSVDPAAIGVLDTARAAAELARAAALLDGVERPGAGHWPPRRARAAALRQSLGALCHARLSSDLRDGVLRPLAAGEAARDDVAQAEVEASARDVRRFGEAARALGGEACERVLRQGVEMLRDGCAPLVDRLRVAEILLGPERAAALLTYP